MVRRAFYSGCLGRLGHYFWLDSQHCCLHESEIMLAIPDFISVWARQWDGGLLKNSRRPDRYDGKVYAVPAKGPWLALVWWDNSVDGRGGSNSGFYVSGFEWEKRQAALEFAMERWPGVVKRQRQPLVLQP